MSALSFSAWKMRKPRESIYINMKIAKNNVDGRVYARTRLSTITLNGSFSMWMSSRKQTNKYSHLFKYTRTVRTKKKKHEIDTTVNLPAR